MSPAADLPAGPLDPRIGEATRRYGCRNVSVMASLLAVGAIAGLACGVLFADDLNATS